MFLGFVGDELGDIPSADDDPLAAWNAARAKVQERLDDPERAKIEFQGLSGTSTFEAAVDKFPADFRQGPIINGAGVDTYPIASYTYLLIPQTFSDVEKAKTIVSFIYWGLTDGQAEEDALGYAALPKSVDDKAIALLHSITVGGSPVWP